MLQRLAQFWASRVKMTHSRWRWVGYFLTLAAVIYLVFTLLQGDLRLDQLDWKAYGWAILASLGFYLISLLIQLFTWARMISFHRRIGWQDVDIYARTVLMRSLPGGAWHWVGRVSMYSGGTEVPTRVVFLGNFLEWALLILSGAAIFLASIDFPILPILAAVLLLGLAIGLAVAWQPAARGWSLRLVEAGLWVGLDGLVWMAGSAILHLLLVSTAGSSWNWQNSVHIWTFSGTFSMLIIFLPSSLGVREISLLALLQPYLSTSVALFVAVLIRFLFIFADIFWGLLGWLLSQAILRRASTIKAIRP